MSRLAGGLPGHTGGVSDVQGATPVGWSPRPMKWRLAGAGRGQPSWSQLVVLVSAEQWQRLEELDSAEATA